MSKNKVGGQVGGQKASGAGKNITSGGSQTAVAVVSRSTLNGTILVSLHSVDGPDATIVNPTQDVRVSSRRAMMGIRRATTSREQASRKPLR